MPAFESLKTQTNDLVFDRDSERTVETMRQRIEELPVRPSSAEAASDTLLKGVAELSFCESSPTLFTDEHHDLQIQWSIDSLGICVTLEVLDSENYVVAYASTNEAATPLHWGLTSQESTLTTLSTFAHLLKQLSDSSTKDITFMTDTAHDFPEPKAKARALIAVEIHVETDPGIDNPVQGYEPAYDFIVIREAEAIHAEFYAGDTAAMKGLCSTEIETYDLDPDNLLTASVIDGLTPPIDEHGYPQQAADEATQQRHYAHKRDAVAQVVWDNTNQTGYGQGLKIADQILTMLSGAQKVQTKPVGR